MTCWRHRFHNQREASSWGCPYQCPKCGWWHVSFFADRQHGGLHILWDKVAFWGGTTLCCLLVLWILVNAFVSWNWPG